jgi:hypothetical protein
VVGSAKRGDDCLERVVVGELELVLEAVGELATVEGLGEIQVEVEHVVGTAAASPAVAAVVVAGIAVAGEGVVAAAAEAVAVVEQTGLEGAVEGSWLGVVVVGAVDLAQLEPRSAVVSAGSGVQLDPALGEIDLLVGLLQLEVGRILEVVDVVP